MKLLIVTQVVDTEDPVLGFFVRWIEEFATHYERIEVICLQEGKHALPINVRVHSLGKEGGRRSRLSYAIRFKELAWQLRNEYDVVFVHMNQEYILIAGLLWKLLSKRVYLWRNHYSGSIFTDLAAAFCTKVFCTSKHSYTARYGKTTIMPVGVDARRFYPDQSVLRTPRSILFLARMAPSKRPDMLIDALKVVAEKGIEFTADFYGSPLAKDEEYYHSLKEKVVGHGLANKITFFAGIPNAEIPNLYWSHEVFVNTSPSGMFDKTLFEAAASGCHILASSADFAALAGSECYFDSAATLAERLATTLTVAGPRVPENLIVTNSLDKLAGELVEAMAPHA